MSSGIRSGIPTGKRKTVASKSKRSNRVVDNGVGPGGPVASAGRNQVVDKPGRNATQRKIENGLEMTKVLPISGRDTVTMATE